MAWLGYDPHLQRLLDHGKLDKHRVKRYDGEPHRCHMNAAELWASDTENSTIVTGYELFRDDLWMQHSWVLKANRLWEGTCKAQKYFGIPLDEKESLKFWVGNFLAHQHSMDEPFSLESLKRYPKVEAVFFKVCNEHGRNSGLVDEHNALTTA